MPSTFPGGLNGMIPLHEASGHLQIEYGRNPKSCKLHKYVSQISCPAPRGSYLEFNPNDAIRKRSAYKWAFGTPAPTGYDNLQGFEQKNFVCERYAFPVTLDKVGVDIASFDVQKIHTKKLALQALINRTEVSLAAITNTANYPAANVVTATVAGGGFLDGGTTADPRIFKALNYAMRLIQVSTGGRAGVAGAKFGVLMSPATAIRLAQTREIREYVMQNEGALKLVTGENEAFMSSTSYMLPDMLYKVETVVEDLYVNTGNPDSTLDVNASMMSDNVLIVYVREGGFNKEYGEADFNTFTTFVYSDMSAKSQVDEWNQLIHLRVEDFFDFKITSNRSACVITNVFS